MNEVFFPIRKRYETDVLVIGGGPTGFSAAVCAATIPTTAIRSSASPPHVRRWVLSASSRPLRYGASGRYCCGIVHQA